MEENAKDIDALATAVENFGAEVSQYLRKTQTQEFSYLTYKGFEVAFGEMGGVKVFLLYSSKQKEDVIRRVFKEIQELFAKMKGNLLQGSTSIEKLEDILIKLIK